MPLVKLDLLGKSGGDIVERVIESVSAALPGKRIVVATTGNETNNMIKRNERWRYRKMALCCCSHVEQGDKEHNEESEQQQQC